MADDDTTTTDTPTSDAPGADAGGKAHSGLDEPHPAGDGERSDREVGGPKLDQDDDAS